MKPWELAVTRMTFRCTPFSLPFRNTAAIVLMERKRQTPRVSEMQATNDVSDLTDREAYDPDASRAAAEREQLMSGEDLRKACSSSGSEWSACGAFIRGVITAYQAGVPRAGGEPPYCLPDRYFAFEWTHDILGFLEANPHFNDAPAVSVVLFAMEAEHPCVS
ncbi:MAG: hypothetical protein H6920_00435 [Sphingomonadaceae bacterium]|nr:hypothetical protein [Sphingomonadaceae bacterium]MCP5384765.1 hypothetical protein [Altererythrobacter sp.]MCP5390081.1 hypothetical protein [Sphingomonadaceae bacterium]MCP5392586.1 hypothetical protein [Sphingomonadaceae bacterium]